VIPIVFKDIESVNQQAKIAGLNVSYEQAGL
jgi:hypothetical protein